MTHNGDPAGRRVDVLRRLAILDTPAEPAYDDIARLASACCQSPIAAVNFVDDERHWTKAIAGVEGGQGASVTADVSFCAATVATDSGLLSMSDTLSSEDWRTHPLVAGPPFVRHYAGASIMVAGEPVGVVCIFGSEPRPIGDHETQALIALAGQASSQLELRLHNLELRDLATTDPLTGLANRTLLMDRLSMALEDRARNGGDVGVLFCDVDDFKRLNDRWGHEAGDRRLCQIAERLMSATRATDTVARFAGDEFVVVCTGLDAAEEFGLVVERIDRLVHTTDRIDGESVPARVSIGAALATDDDTPDSLLRRADQAMYDTKTHKRVRRRPS